MLIRRIEVFSYDLTYRHGSYIMSGNQVIDRLPSTVVRVITDDGLDGWGEVCPLGPLYLASHGLGARAALQEIVPHLIGIDPINISSVTRAMDGALRGHSYAKSPVDIACWDLLGKVAGLSVTTLLGGQQQGSFPLYMAVPLGPPDEMRQYVVDRKAEGIHRFQLKVGADPYLDADRVRQVLDAITAEDLVVADANGGWILQDAVIAARLLDGFDRLLLEEPCRTLEECLYVRERTSLPMVLDEVITDVQTLLRAFNAGGMEAINLKISKFGGLSGSKLIRDLAIQLGLRVTIEDSWGGDLVTAAVSHLAASTPADHVLTVSFMNDWTNEHIANYQPRSQHGSGSAPEGQGLGVEIDIDRLGEPLFAVED